MEGYRFLQPIEVRFRDLDAVGHVNNAVYLTYIESARVAWWIQTTGRPSLRDLTIILARTEIDYRRPVAFGDRLVVGLRCVSMGRSSFVLEFRIEDAATGQLVAEARNVLVYYDYAAGRSTPLPPDLRARIKAAEPGVAEA